MKTQTILIALVLVVALILLFKPKAEAEIPSVTREVEVQQPNQPQGVLDTIKNAQQQIQATQKSVLQVFNV